MAAITKSGMNLLLLLGVLVVISAAAAAADDDDENDGKVATLYYHRHRNHRRVPPPAPVVTPPPPPSPPLPTPPPPSPTGHCPCCDMCTIEPCLEPLPTPSSVGHTEMAPPAAAAAATTNCVAALAGLAPCTEYLTGGARQIPGPYGPCCRGLAAFLQSAAGDEGRLGCFCPLLHGDVNRWIARPVQTARLLFLQVACSVQYPPKLVSLCFNQTAAP